MFENKIKRDYGFDNIKFILIVLVVFGHVLEEISIFGTLGVLRAIIYSFHMPLFVFVSGYFSKKSTKKTERVFTEYLIPFFVFNTFFVMLFERSLMVNVLLPVYTFWYLLSLFFWSISIEYINKFKPIIIVSVLLGLYCGCFDSIDRLFSLSRSICFFPFFIIGYRFDENQINKIRSSKKIFPILGIAFSVLITASLNIKEIIPIKMYEMLQSYNNTGVGEIEGVIQRIFIYAVATIMIFSVISVIPNKKYWFTLYGTRTICIYIFSSYLIKIIFKIIKLTGTTFIFKNTVVEIIGSLIISLVVLVITGNKCSYKMYRLLIQAIRKVFIKA